MNALDRAIEVTRGVSKLANLVGLGQSAISNWRTRGQVPVDNCPAIERATGGTVRCEHLRPDVTWQRDEVTGVVTGYTVPVAPVIDQPTTEQETRDAA